MVVVEEILNLGFIFKCTILEILGIFSTCDVEVVTWNAMMVGP
jgi:hypothetical protein